MNFKGATESGPSGWEGRQPVEPAFSEVEPGLPQRIIHHSNTDHSRDGYILFTAENKNIH